MKPAAPPASSSPPVVIRAEGGLVTCCATTGFIAGGNVSATPHAIDGLEVGGDAAFGRFGGLTFFYFAADGLYAVPVRRVKVYGGGGFGVTKTSAGGPTNAGAQIVAGMQWPASGRHTLRVEARFLFLPVETTFILGSISF